MRTTLNVDDDVLQAVRERARHERRTAGEVLSELAREALTGKSRFGDGGRTRNGFRPLPHRGPPVTNALVDELRELDDE